MFETKLSKLRVVESWKLFESCQTLKLLNIENCQSWKLLNLESCQSWMLKVVECWKLLNLESCLKVVKHWGCWILRIVKVESWKLSKLNVESCQTLKVLNIESLLIVRICCLLTSFQRRLYCTQSDIKRIKRSEELWKVIYSKRNSTSSRLLF